MQFSNTPFTLFYTCASAFINSDSYPIGPVETNLKTSERLLHTFVDFQIRADFDALTDFVPTYIKNSKNVLNLGGKLVRNAALIASSAYIV